MHWMNPQGAWALTALAAILCLYILRQKMEPLEVSSTFLWRKALASMEADRPFQKLRRNLLMFLQLLLALLLAFSIMRPMTLGGETGEVIFVFDLSASMQANDGQSTRLEASVADAVRRVEGLPDGARVSVLTAGAQVQQLIARTADLAHARRTLEGLTPQNGGADLDGALSLALALQKELEDAEIVVYSDQALPDIGAIKPMVGPGLANRAILSVSASDTAAVARVVNHGEKTRVTVECHADDALVDIRTVDLEAGETASVLFDLPAPAQKVTATIVEEDALSPDNTRVWVRRETGTTTVVLAGRDNIFVEKALQLRLDVSVLKTTLAESSVVSGGALTVIDGPLPEALPARGALLLLDPDAYVGELIDTPAVLSAAAGPAADALNEYLQVDEIQVSRYRPVIGGDPVWLANGQPVLSILEENGRLIAVLGFDIHEANLPLLKEFPLFMQRLLSTLAPEPLGAGFEDGDAGSTLLITPQSIAMSAEIVTPSGRHVAHPVTGGAFSDTDEIGIYTLLETDEDENVTSLPFSLHMPAAESDVQTVATGNDQAAQSGRSARYGREWTPWLIGLILAVMLLEWWVYRRGY